VKSDLVGIEIRRMISEIGKKWHNSLNNPKVSNDLLYYWEDLISEWKNADDLPLVVRKQTAIRGSEVTHKSDKKIIITDNSFSQWIYYNILNHKKYTLSEIEELLEKDEIPFSYAIKKIDKERVKYKKCIGNYSVNKQGWKLCHINQVGIKSSEPIENMEIEELKKHFTKLANPKNMFLIPLEIGGIGEISEFISQQKIEIS
jgi:hypothetical protein